MFSLLNPVLHANTPEGVAAYKAEPYVVAADVYGKPPHAGRGGWSWYTGAAGWMYRLLVETLLGVGLEGNRLRLTPRPPQGWDSYKIHYRYRRTFYHITIAFCGAGEAPCLVLDDRAIEADTVPLVDDGREHSVEMKIARPSAPRP
jgi:cellobiose phosphorylase